MHRPVLILMSGPPGTGKTTFVRALARRLAFEHLESDAVRRSLSAQPSYSKDESRRVFAMVERRVGEVLRDGRLAVVDATNLRRGDRRRFTRAAREAGAALIVVRVTAPPDIVRERLAAPREGYSQATAEVYELMQGRAEPIAGAHVVVDTRYDIGPSAELVVVLSTGREP